jgi:hypothetical protein
VHAVAALCCKVQIVLTVGGGEDASQDTAQKGGPSEVIAVANILSNTVRGDRARASAPTAGESVAGGAAALSAQELSEFCETSRMATQKTIMKNSSNCEREVTEGDLMAMTVDCFNSP